MECDNGLSESGIMDMYMVTLPHTTVWLRDGGVLEFPGGDKHDEGSSETVLVGSWILSNIPTITLRPRSTPHK